MPDQGNPEVPPGGLSSCVSMLSAIATLAVVVIGAAVAWVQLNSEGRIAILVALAVAIAGTWLTAVQRTIRRIRACGVSDREPPDDTLAELARQVLGSADWCRVPKAVEQGGAAIALVVSAQLEWQCNVIHDHLTAYLREWARETKIGDQAVTAMFYEISRRAAIAMALVSFDNRYLALIGKHERLRHLLDGLAQIRREFRESVEQLLLFAQDQNNRAQAQTTAAGNVEEPLRRCEDLHAEVQDWQNAARASAATLRQRLLTTA